MLSDNLRGRFFVSFREGDKEPSPVSEPPVSEPPVFEPVSELVSEPSPLSQSFVYSFSDLCSIIPYRQQALFHLRREDIHIKIYGMPQELPKTAE